MFTEKSKQLEQQRRQYLIDITNYNYLIEARLFYIQKTFYQNSGIEYTTNGFNTITIKILKNKNIESIRLPYWNKKLSVWENKLYTIEEIKSSKQDQLIEHYIIKIIEVKEINKQNSKEFKALEEENQKLKLELKSLQNENEELKSKNQSLQKENEELKSINESLKYNTNTQIVNEYTAEVRIDSDIIINNKEITLDFEEKEYSYTLSQIFDQDFNLKINNNIIKINPIFESEYITRQDNNIIYFYNYSSKYKNQFISLPEPLNKISNINIQLIDTTYFIASKEHYNIYIHITLVDQQ